MRKRVAFASIFAPNFKRACDFLLKIRRGVSPEVFVEHFNVVLYLNHSFLACIIIQAKMRKRVAFAGIFAPNFKRACEFLLKIRRGVSPEVFVEHFNACIISSPHRNKLRSRLKSLCVLPTVIRAAR